jgi:hypothetical protein
MKKGLVILATVLVLLSPAIGAAEPSYSYVQGNWSSVEPDQGDSGSGPMLDLSYGVTNLFHVVGSYEDVSFDAADATTWQAGAGIHQSVGEGFDLVGEATYVDFEVDQTLTTGTESEEGFAVNGLARKLLGKSWEVNGGIEYIDVGDSDDTLFGVNALYTMKERYALGAGYKVGDFDTLFVGFRLSFGPN